MASRSNEKSVSPLGRIRERIRSTLFASTEGTVGEPDGEFDETGNTVPRPDAPGNLFHCSSCGTVYIASEKHVCSNCEEDVEEVRSTLKSPVVR